MERRLGDNMDMYTDGGCHNNGDRKGQGSYAFLYKTDNKDYVDVKCGFNYDSTNNRMEMKAIIIGIDRCNIEPNESLRIITDSGYVVKGLTDPRYLDTWKRNGWKTSANKPVLNKELWEHLSRLLWHFPCTFKHIRGHNKCNDKEHAYWNDICDRVCTFIMNKKECNTPGILYTARFNHKTKEIDIINVELIIDTIGG